MKRGQTKRNRAFRVNLKPLRDDSLRFFNVPLEMYDKPVNPQIQAYMQSLLMQKGVEFQNATDVLKARIEHRIVEMKGFIQQMEEARGEYKPMTWEEVAEKGREITNNQSKRK